MTARARDGVTDGTEGREPPRLRELTPDEDLAGVAELVRAVAVPVPELTPHARQRGRARLRRALGVGGRRRRRWAVLRPALLVVAALTSASVGGAAVYSVIVERRLATEASNAGEGRADRGPGGKRAGRARPAGEPAPALVALPLPTDGEEPTTTHAPASELALPSSEKPEPPPPPSGSKVGARPRGASALVASAEVTASPRGASLGVVERAPTPGPGPAAGVTPPPLAPPPLVPPPLATVPPPAPSPRMPAPSVSGPTAAHAPPVGARLEMEALAEALRRLRTTDDAPGALAVLDELATRFPRSALAPEVSAVRIEALLKAGRSSAALAELDRAPLDGSPGHDARLVVRGELRAQAGRWREADADFGRALAARLDGARDELAERALWGRAVARSRLGDTAGTRQSCARYLERFPDGRFAEPVRRLARSLAGGVPAAGSP